MREQSIFIEALEKDDPAEREAFLDRACAADPALRPRIERLFRRHEQADAVLDAPPAWSAVTVDDEPITEGPGTLIGAYKLLEQIGEGGMGAVYVAEQSQPVRRRVALKVIKLGMDTKQVIARFEAERQALAMMDHPGIAKVFDAGTTHAGRPYFVMELVRGIPITEYCDREQLSIPERLELFVLVCRAVQHAHQKGIIHRDLKPSNILVTVIDGAAVPKVIDFGVAKATGASLTERTIYTAFHQFIGTPLYMSPEQADLSGMDMDTRSDIYSLGVLLYELLTGTTPFDQETFRQAAFDEVRRMIREDEPPRPSTRLSSLGATRSTMSANRKSDPRHLDRTVHGELDWIVMKALEKDRKRRYETANDFAADVVRHLTDQPVEACPPSAWYRARKFAGRNRVMMVASTLVVLSLLAGTVVSTWQAVVAARARTQTAEALATARVAVDEMYTRFASEWLSQKPNLTPIQRELLEKSLAFYEKFAANPDVDEESQFYAARARTRVGDIEKRLGRPDQAEAAYRRSIDQLEELVARRSGRDDYARELSYALQSLASQLHARGVDANGKPSKQQDVMPLIRRSVRVIEGAVGRHPEDREHRRRLAEGTLALGQAQFIYGELKEAEATLERGSDHYQRLVAESPSDTEARRGIANSEDYLSRVLLLTGRRLESERAHRRAVSNLERLLADEPLDHPPRVALAACLQMSRPIFERGREERLRDSRRSVDLYESLVRDFPKVQEYRDNLVYSLTGLFGELVNRDRSGEVVEVGRRRVELVEALLKDYPDLADRYRQKLSMALIELADLYTFSPPGDPFHDPSRGLELARRAEGMPPEEVTRQSLTWARIRNGEWKAGVEALKEDDPGGCFFLAMAHWHLGDRDKARRLFDHGSAGLDKYEGRVEQRWRETGEDIYPFPSMLRRLQREVAALLGMEPPRGEGTHPAGPTPTPRPTGPG